ncbi:MAG: class I SAM-dependent methyltransferase [Rhodomicrobium sp.]
MGGRDHYECEIVMPYTNTIGRRTARRLERTLNSVLYQRYGFDDWHIANGSHCRPYKRILADKINGLEPKLGLVVEAGCGLGDILRHIRAAKRIGYDIDEGVIKAARIRNLFETVEFRLGSLDCITEHSIDVFIAVNWIHSVPRSDIAEMLLLLVPRARHIVLDRIDDSAHSSYKYRHDFSFLQELGTLECSFRVPDEPRSFMIWQIQ